MEKDTQVMTITTALVTASHTHNYKPTLAHPYMYFYFSVSVYYLPPDLPQPQKACVALLAQNLVQSWAQCVCWLSAQMNSTAATFERVA